MLPNDDAVIDEILRGAKNVAVVGMSNKKWRASHHIGRYLAQNGYRVFPVNPGADGYSERAVLSDLDAAQAAAREQTGTPIDLVDVFRLERTCAGDRG